MPPSQLKRLKASLREQGIVGPQQSKKQKKQNAQNGVTKDKRVNRNEALSTIRDQFNPFEYKWSKGPKFEATTSKRAGQKDGKGGIVGRPYAAKSRAEESYKKTLLLDRERRNKVGGVTDRRFGEDDPSMDPELKMMERFTHEAQRRNKSSAFDLEDDEPGELTHMGKSLSLDAPALKDDYEEDDVELSDAEDHPSDEDRQSRKRARFEGDEGSEEEEDEEGRPERKKSKQEVMKELIAKSKLHKYERQAAKDDDDDLREELDKELPGIHALLRGMAPKPVPPAVVAGMNPERAAMLSNMDKVKADKEYDMRLRQMAQDKRSQPTERSKPEEEITAENATKLQEIEAKRLRRMEGAQESDEEADVKDVLDEEDEEEDFGFGEGLQSRPSKRPSAADLGIEEGDEDEFDLDDELVTSGSEIESDDDASEDGSEGSELDAEDAQFLESLQSDRPDFLSGANGPLEEMEPLQKNGIDGNLAHTFDCPQSHRELVEITAEVQIMDLPAAVQRIRLQYDPKLQSENKSKLGKFAVSLVDHISYLANQKDRPPFSVLETLIRHIHSMARVQYPVEIANAFRRHLTEIQGSRAMSLTVGDLVILTAIGTIFPTSDHFHQVVTPAVLTMGRYLGLKIPQNLSDFARGAYLCTLCLQYQRLSKRYIPEVMNCIQNSLYVLAPNKMSMRPGNFPLHEPKSIFEAEDRSGSARTLSIYDCDAEKLSENEQGSLKASILETNLKLLDAAIDIWVGKSAFFEVFEPASKLVQHLNSKSCRTKLPNSTHTLTSKLSEKLSILLSQATLSRRPLELHHHKPLAIKTSIPKFEDSYNPDKHYDPDRERTEAAKLKKEYKRERKGAIRELRKDAKVVARESLREKKERDAAYEKKYKRLVAEIQGEEGKEAKAYEREKEWRKKGKK